MLKVYLLCLFCWVTQIANAQISLVKQFDVCCPIDQFEPMGSYFLFNAEDKLWRSDGTTVGTTLVAEVKLPRAEWRCRIGNTLYFFINNARELWKTDGTVSGTQLVKVLGPGFQEPLVNVNGLLVFGFNTAATGTELWRSDGTGAGTYLITDLIPGTGNGYGYVSPQTAVLNGFFYFLGGPPVSTGILNIGSRQALYRTDGTAAGTTQVTNGGFEPNGMNVQNSRLVYKAYQPTSYSCQEIGNPDYTSVLMKIENGVASILKRPVDVYPFGSTGCPLTPIGNTFLDTYQFINSGNYQYFRTRTEITLGQSPGYNIWRTDGTTNGTIPITNYPANSTEGPVGNAQFIWNINARSNYGFSNLAYFPLKSNTSGIELWRSDGTAAGTYLLKDINPSGDANPTVASTHNGVTYFFATDPVNGTELWRTDGTAAGTQLVQDLNPGTAGQTANEGMALGQNFYFWGTKGNPSTGNGLYTTCLSPVPTLSVLPSATICAGTSTTLSAAGCSGTVTWSTGATGNSILLAPTASTTYTATCTQSGCSVSNPASLSLTVKPTPAAPTIRAFGCTATPTQLWAKRYGGNNLDLPTSILELSDGNLLWIGTSSSPISGDKTVANRGGDDAWVIKTDANGNKLWDKVYGGLGGDYPNTAIASPDGGAIIAMASNSGADGDKTTANYGAGDIWIIRIDGNGNLVRQWSFGGGIEDSPSSLIATSDGNYVLSAVSYSAGGTGNKNATTAPSYSGGDMWLIKFDPNSTNPTGGGIWQRTYGGSLLDQPVQLLEMPDNDIMVAGYSASNAGTGNKTSVNFDGTAGLSDYWVLRVSSDGSQIRWQQSYGGAKAATDPAGQGFGDDFLWSICRSNTQGNYILGGNTQSQANTGNKTTALRGANDGWFVEINGATGSKLAEKTIGGANREDFGRIVPMPNGTGYWVSMRVSNAISQDVSATPLGMLDIWVTEIDNNLSLPARWDRRYGGLYDDSPRRVSVLTDGSLIIVGNQSTDASNSNLFNDFYAVKTGSCTGTTTLTACAGLGVTLSDTGCAGSVTWSTGATGVMIQVYPTATTTYTATCTVDGCNSPASNPVTVTILTTMETVKSGNWNDPTLWSCGRVPTAADAVTLKHTVTIPASYVGNALRLQYSALGRLLYKTSSRVRLGP